VNEEMMKALEVDGEKLRHLTGEDHGPHFVCDHRETSEWKWGKLPFYTCDACGETWDNPNPIVIHKPMIVDPGQS
jgi:hypothetical protein